MAHWGFKLCDDVRLKLAVGPYVAVGIGGRTHAYVSSSKYNIDEETGVGQYEYRNDYYRFGTFKGKAVNEEFGFEASPRLDWGGTASVGIAVKRISFTIGYDLAWGKYNKEQNDLRIRNHMVSFISGYTFDKKRINETNIHKISCLRLLNEEFCVCLFFHKHDKSSIYEENAIHYPFNGRSVYDCLCCKGTGTLARIPAGREVHTRKIEHHVVFYCGGSALVPER